MTPCGVVRTPAEIIKRHVEVVRKGTKHVGRFKCNAPPETCSGGNAGQHKMNVRFFRMLHRKDVREMREGMKNLEEKAGSLIEELKLAECKTEHDLQKLRKILNWIDLEYVEELGKKHQGLY